MGLNVLHMSGICQWIDICVPSSNVAISVYRFVASVMSLFILQQTILTVLDCMIEHHRSSVEGIKVYYNVLESDEEGRPPSDPLYEPTNKSPMQIIAKQGEKVHPLFCLTH